jgi:hypothetical protein
MVARKLDEIIEIHDHALHRTGGAESAIEGTGMYKNGPRQTR